MLLLAKEYDKNKHNIDNWWASEKLNGMRAYWDGCKLTTRNGKYIFAPDWFIDELPLVPLDGELYYVAGLEPTLSIVKKHKPIDGEWKRIIYHIFDTPSDNSDYLFEDRIDFLNTLKLPEFVKIVPHFKIKNHDEVMEIASRYWDKNKEGLMLRRPQSPYVRKRSDILLKIKNVHDCIAKVIQVLPGQGKYHGKLGAIEVDWYGTIFNIGTGFSDKQRKDFYFNGSEYLKKGTEVRFEFTELTNNRIPRHPRFISIYDE